MWGKQVRLARLMPQGKMICVPMDHGVTDGPIKGIENIVEAVKRVEGQATCVVLHKGSIKALREPPNVSVMMHLSASTYVGPEPNHKVRVGDVLEALRLGAEGVSVHVNVGGEPSEPEMLRKLGEVAAEADELGVPLLAMMYARGPNIKDKYDPEKIALVARVGAELGADIVKVPYTGSRESFEKVVNGVHVPVVIAGGPKVSSDLDVLKMVYDAVQAGAAGIAFGRNVFQRDDPGKFLEAIRGIIYKGMKPEEAVELLG